jgi:O-antigen/teichoic acid export membrane protein
VGSRRVDTAAAHDRFLRDVFPIGLGILFSALYFRIDVLLVQLWLGTEAVAAYNAVFRLIDALRLFPAAVLAVVLPVLCRAGDLRPLAYVSTAVTGGAVIAAALLWVASDRVVTLAFGPHYRAAVPAFRVLVLALPLLSLNFALTHQLVAWNHQRAYAVVCGTALVTNLALNAWLIPTLSIEGAAWATLGTELCVTSGCLVALGALI